MTATDDALRAQFESWYAEKYGYQIHALPAMNGLYRQHTARASWEAYQAASAAQSAELARLRGMEKVNKILLAAVEYYASESASYYSDCSGNPGADNGEWAREALGEIAALASRNGGGDRG